jgi:hypothetical protein
MIAPFFIAGSRCDVCDRPSRHVVDALSEGLAITIAPHNTMLTTQEPPT